MKDQMPFFLLRVPIELRAWSVKCTLQSKWNWMRKKLVVEWTNNKQQQTKRPNNQHNTQKPENSDFQELGETGETTPSKTSLSETLITAPRWNRHFTSQNCPLWCKGNSNCLCIYPVVIRKERLVHPRVGWWRCQRYLTLTKITSGGLDHS